MRAIGLTCLAGALWGTVGVATQLTGGGRTLAPEVSALSRTVLGALVLLGAAAFIAPSRGSGGAATPWTLVAVFGAAGAAFQITLFASYPVVGVTVAVVVTACLPVVLVAVWDAVVARRPPGPILAGSILVAGAGVVLTGIGSVTPGPIAPAGPAGLALVAFSARACRRRARQVSASRPPPRQSLRSRPEDCSSAARGRRRAPACRRATSSCSPMWASSRPAGRTSHS